MHKHMWMQVLVEARGIWFPRNCSYKWLWAVLQRYWEPRLFFCFCKNSTYSSSKEQCMLLTIKQSLKLPPQDCIFCTLPFRQCLVYSQSTNTGVWTTQGRIWFCSIKFSRKIEKSEICCDWGTKERLHRVGGYEVDWPFQSKAYPRKKGTLCHE